MRITQLEVQGLFGIFNHLIPLNTDEHITIIHGPNGYGKTVLLKLVNGIFNGRYGFLRAMPYKKIKISFDNKAALEVTTVQEQERPRRKRQTPGFKLQFQYSPSQVAFLPLVVHRGVRNPHHLKQPHTLRLFRLG